MDISKYYAEICKTPLMSREQETYLMEKYFNDETSDAEKASIRDSVINANLRYVFNLARRYSKGDTHTFLELIAAGNEGLIVGFDKYKLGKGTRVLSYAGDWIFQRIQAEMASMRIVHLPIYKQQLAANIKKTIESNEDITLEELKKSFEGKGISPKDIEELYKTQYLTFYISDFEENSFEINPIEDEVQQKIDDESCLSKVNQLPSPYREVIARCFGLLDNKEQSVSRISKALKLPKKDIQMYKEKGLEMLRDLFLVET